MQIYRNNELIVVSSNCLHALLLEWGYEIPAIAVALNQVFVPRSNYDQILLQAGDKIDIVSAMQGG